jgi:hypothetical protein
MYSIVQSIYKAEIIEEYHVDFPCPSALLLLKIKFECLHCVIANCEDNVRIITIYKPDPLKWSEYKKRLN